MSRLTERRGENIWYCSPDGRKFPYSCMNNDDVKHAMEKLEQYEEAEEQGRLIELPCKVGDTVYAIRYGESKPFIIVETHIVEIRNNLHGWIFIHNESMRGFKLGDFGRIVFLTKEEAEAKLAELKGSE